MSALFDVPEGSVRAVHRRAMGGHQSSRAETTTWLTPRYILDALGAFALDPCAAAGWTTAERHIILPDDGLTAEWSGRVWLNPPYGTEAAVWLEKLAAHRSGLALIFARTETAWFVSQVWEKATAVMFLHGRLRFLRADGSEPEYTSGAPSCLVAYSIEDAAVLRSCPLSGTVVALGGESA